VKRKKIAIVGGGITGLTAAYYLTQKGFKTAVFEKENHFGGLSATFKRKNWNWPLEFFFHHLFTSDLDAKKLIKELGLEEKLFFKKPKSSVFYQGKIFQIDSPVSVLKFLPLNFFDRLRVGLVTIYIKTFLNWQNLKNQKAIVFSKTFFGQRVNQILWQPLLKGKFGPFYKKISAAWFWARIKKRSSYLGYLEGGFQTLIDTLVQKVKQEGGQIYLKKEIRSLSQLKEFDLVLITTPGQIFFEDKAWPEMLGAINLVLILKKPFFEDQTYWLNINEKHFPFIAVVEQTNFINKENYNQESLLYLGGYYHQNHPFFKKTKKQLLEEFLPFVEKINPRFNFEENLIDSFLFKNLSAQPIITPAYYQNLKKLEKQKKKVIVANMQLIYPYDRGINYAIRMGKKAAEKISQNKI